MNLSEIHCTQSSDQSKTGTNLKICNTGLWHSYIEMSFKLPNTYKLILIKILANLGNSLLIM